MKSTSCIKKGMLVASRFVERKVTRSGSVKYQNAYYSHQALKQYEGCNVLIVKGLESIRVLDAMLKLICVAKKSLDLPPPEKRGKGGAA